MKETRLRMCEHSSKIAVLIFAIVTLTGLSSSYRPAAGAEQAISRPELSIELNEPQLRVGAKFTLTVRIESSRSVEPVFFTPLKWGILGGLYLRVREARSGATVEPRYMDDSIITPAEAQNPQWYARIPRGVFFGIRRTEAVKDYFPTPGKYLVDVAYQCPLPRAAAPVKEFWSTEDGVLYSNTVEVDVVAP